MVNLLNKSSSYVYLSLSLSIKILNFCIEIYTSNETLKRPKLNYIIVDIDLQKYEVFRTLEYEPY